jgi:hypothetical protein
MFSYREFVEGSRKFRGSTPDRDYEEVRSDNELAVLHLSRTTQASDLATILTYLEPMLYTTDRVNPTTFEDCLRFSTLFTYFKIIAQKCDIAMTRLDDIYTDTTIDYYMSTGGLIYTMRPGGRYSEELARVRAKVPITTTLGRVRTIVHEVFVAIVALNPLRRFIPSFSYVFSYWNCGNFTDSNVYLSGLCATPGTRPVIIYESNPSAIPLVRRMEKPITLSSVLDWLLQLMGALEWAHSYADYTHYDLHSGNVLVQDLDEPISIQFQNYSVTTRERIIIIDNGLAHCQYHYSKSGIQLFIPKSFNEDAERLETTRMLHYGSVQNSQIGVSSQRSYPLGDVFRIFFDIFSTVSSSLKSELKPLLNHFFTDFNIGQLITKTVTSLEYGFSLPPFREDMYKYRYLDFANAILKQYDLPSVKQTGFSIVVPSIKLSDIIDWKTPNAEFIPTYYEVGILKQLGKIVLPFESNKTETLDDLYSMQASLEKFVYGSQWGEIPNVSLSLKAILDTNFHKIYSENVWLSVNHVQRIRAIYSNCIVLSHSLSIFEPDKSPVQTLASTLIVKPEDLRSLASYCKRSRIPTRTKVAFSNMQKLTEQLVELMRTTQLPDRITPQNRFVNWYKACLPGIQNYLRFCVQWGEEDADFGDLDLPHIE